jgi:hypothetical protein
MRRHKLLLSLLVAASAMTACYDDREYAQPPVDLTDYSYTEEFDTVSAAVKRGWVIKNASAPKGTHIWAQGCLNDPAITGWPAIPFSAFSSKGTFPGFIGADYTSTSAQVGVISNWLISPVTTMKNGDKISFYTRTLSVPYNLTSTVIDTSDFANRLQVRVVPEDNVEVGAGIDPGAFTTLLLDINPNQVAWHTAPNPAPTPANPAWTLRAPNAYPQNWTRFEATVIGINGPVKGRFAFRYYVTGAGSNGNATLVAIDRVQFEPAN